MANGFARINDPDAFRTELQRLKNLGIGGNIGLLQKDPKGSGTFGENFLFTAQSLLPQNPRQKQKRLPVFGQSAARRGPEPSQLAGAFGSLGLTNALTIGGVEGRLGQQGVAGNPLSIGKLRNKRI